MVTLVPALLSAATVAVGAVTLAPLTPLAASPFTSRPSTAAPPAASPAVSRAAAPTVPAAVPAAAQLLAWSGPTTSPSTGDRSAVPVPVPRSGWRWPLEPRPAVTSAFEAPLSAWARGHRGVDLLARAGQPVLAVAAGRVTHAGVVAGRGTVTVLHSGGVSTTYEPLEAGVRTGAHVAAGQVLGVVQEGGSHCRGCLHLGALRSRVYLDPLTLLRSSRVVLLPLTER